MKKIIFLLFIFILLLSASIFIYFFLLPPKQTQAGTSQNVSGWAWSENIGWVSFNNTSGGGNISYGVDVDIGPNNKFSGYVWSEHIGWIDFSPSPPYPVAPNTSVKVDKQTGVVSGWARALNYGGGWDGWLRMQDVSVDNCSGELFGWAFGDLIGWLSFNSANCDSNKDNITDTGYYGQCPVGLAVSDYSLVSSALSNDGPTAANLSVNLGDYCVLARHPVFHWKFSDPNPGDTQQYYQILIDDDQNIQANPLIDSGKIATAGEGPDYFYDPASPSIFTYNTTFYWGVKVWDDCQESPWVESSFTTPLHEYPDPAFTWLPFRPSKGEFAQFCAVAQPGVCASDVSKCYATGGGEISCSGANFIWTFPAGTEFSTTTSEVSKNPEVKLSETGWQKVYLNINDGVGSCTSSADISISKPLPKWKEVAP